MAKKGKTQEVFEKEIKEIFGDRVLITGEYKNWLSKVEVETKYGKCLVLPNNLLQGFFPSVQTAINQNDYFINQAREIHGDKYDYSELVYKGSREKIKIICPIHGEFYTTPDHHLHNVGCQTCENLSKEGIYSLSNIEKHKDDYKQIKATLYVIECWNEDNTERFIKVGVTRDLKTRFSGSKKMPYKYRIVDTVDTDLYEASKIENKLHKEHTGKYVPSIKFGGYTECYEYNDSWNYVL